MIKNKGQYNQGVGKYKILSSNAGVGSIIPTQWGGFIMPLSISKWTSIIDFSNRLHDGLTDEGLKIICEQTAVTVIKDERFVEYLRRNQYLESLKFLVKVPHLNLNNDNQCDYENHPLFDKWKNQNAKLPGESDYAYESRFGRYITVPAIVFPRWFRSSNPGSRPYLMTIDEWFEKWKEAAGENNDYNFVPPRDYQNPKEKKEKIKNKKNEENKDTENIKEKTTKYYAPLEQVTMVLICPKGHISDIPWDKYFALKIQLEEDKLPKDFSELFSVDAATCTKSPDKKHKLKWVPSRSNPESYGTLKCEHCEKWTSLEGIMNIKPKCIGEKPWVGNNAKEKCDEEMTWALVTSNSIYYADSFSSLYVPKELYSKAPTLDAESKEVYDILIKKFTDSGKSHDEFFDMQFGTVVADCAEDLGLEISNNIVGVVKNLFLSEDQSNEIVYIVLKSRLKNITYSPYEAIPILCILKIGEDNNMTITANKAQNIYNKFCDSDSIQASTKEDYRWIEYDVFLKNEEVTKKDLAFNDISLSETSFEDYFNKIQQVSVLAISSTQLNFSRVKMLQPELDEQGKLQYPSGQKIFAGDANAVKVIPANQNFGEGIFFSFKKERLDEWSKQDLVKERYANLNEGDLGKQLKIRMDEYGAAKFYLLHTFSHIMMKELEFSCGYPTASLKERLYYSEKMCGVLIYTADGSEGSMGGLVWQGQPRLINEIIKSALNRAEDCASDPLCWENIDQLNLATCFSCSMVSETSCEERNLGLDRRALIDPQFGFFKEFA